MPPNPINYTVPPNPYGTRPPINYTGIHGNYMVHPAVPPGVLNLYGAGPPINYMMPPGVPPNPYGTGIHGNYMVPPAVRSVINAPSQNYYGHNNYGGFGSSRAPESRPHPKSKKEVEKEVLVGVNRYIRDFYENLGVIRRKDAQNRKIPGKKSGKSAPVSDSTESSLFQRGEVTSVEEYIAYNTCSAEVPFDFRVRSAVERTYPTFYKDYKTPNDVKKALLNFNVLWTW